MAEQDMKEVNLQQLRTTVQRLTQLTGKIEARVAELRMLLDAARQQLHNETQGDGTLHSDDHRHSDNDSGLSE